MMGDHVNPILVKELRQSARSRSLLVMAVLTLLACVLMSLRVLTRQRGMYEPTAGQDLFEMLYFCLSIVGFLVVPTIAHRSLAREQEEGGWELLQLTGLGPRRILLGKLASSLVVGAVFTAVVTPFFLVSFGLGGVQLRVLVRVAAYGAAMTAALSIGTLFAAAVPATRVQRTAMQLITLVGLVLALGAIRPGTFSTPKRIPRAHCCGSRRSRRPAWSCSRRRRPAWRSRRSATRAGPVWRSRC